jgi:hypothetical protein
MMQHQLETMISLPAFEKARSIRHCCQLFGDGEISVERKYDGEYCQVHVRAGTAGDSYVTFLLQERSKFDYGSEAASPHH